MLLLYQEAPIFLHGFNYQLGRICRDLNELKDKKLLIGDVDAAWCCFL
jgi:hypothetical protein